MILIKHCTLLPINEVISLGRCIIVTSFQSASLKDSFEFREGDFIICADGGYAHARAESIVPDVVIGDFDSIDFEFVKSNLHQTGSAGSQIIRVAAEKDDTDTLICLKHGIDLGYEEFIILGGLGGRMDHTMANLQTMAYAVDHQKTIWIHDGKNHATLRNPGSINVQKIDSSKISLFAFESCCEGVSIRNVKYPLSDHLLKNNFPLGISNEFLGNESEISHKSGKLLIILSLD